VPPKTSFSVVRPGVNSPPASKAAWSSKVHQTGFRSRSQAGIGPLALGHVIDFSVGKLSTNSSFNVFWVPDKMADYKADGNASPSFQWHQKAAKLVLTSLWKKSADQSQSSLRGLQHQRNVAKRPRPSVCRLEFALRVSALGIFALPTSRYSAFSSAAIQQCRQSTHQHQGLKRAGTRLRLRYTAWRRLFLAQTFRAPR